ncbi:MAG: type I glyceraldehyde-3-phosphate dehydrogenase, partial [Myxococcota bacterium]|nr:type I glyceraldehyde-3-phosphate dehydrogenase [Myxococcota bacterium]
IISAPAKKGNVKTIVVGVNDAELTADHDIVSNASCTTNCLSPVAKVLNDAFGIESGLMTTIHAYTGNQKILDAPHKDLRRGRSAAMSMIPTTTGAAQAVAKVLPELDGKLNGMAIRVPTPNVSLVDFVFSTQKSVTAEAINAAIKAAADGSMKGVLGYSEEPLVSVDHVGNPHSSTVDLGITQTMGDKMAKILSWYDNEWGFSCRMIDLAKLMNAAS